MKGTYSDEVTIQPGGVVKIESPSLPAGARAWVIVIVEEADGSVPALSSLCGRSAPAFKSAAEVDEFVRRERDSWNS